MAAHSNLAFKTAMVATLGNRALLGRMAALSGTGLVAGFLLLAFWSRFF